MANWIEKLKTLIETVDTAVDALATGVVVNSRSTAGTRMKGVPQVATATWDLLRGGLGAGTDSLFSGMIAGCIIESLIVRMPTTPDVSDGDPITSLAIATNDVEPGIIIAADNAPVASMTPEAQFAWTGALYIPADTEIEGTIAGGDADEECLVIIIATYRAVVSGGYLSS
ncbi:unnamed protein product [marine sediment metagenome]|uniref:Uncharacterized protein n=1 Tax=marine sediment metagenome TaxID=412755 RepID=X1STZ9_9ZZZZ